MESLTKIKESAQETLNRLEEIKKQQQWAIVSNKLALRPIADRIVILEDTFKSGLECKVCNGVGHTDEICPVCKGSKFEVFIDENENETHSSCRACTTGTSGARKTYGYKLCPACNGRTALVIVPDENKRRPTTGTVMAIGSQVTEYVVGAKVLYTNYTGSLFELEGNINIRIMRQHDVACEVKSLNAQTPEQYSYKEFAESGIQDI